MVVAMAGKIEHDQRVTAKRGRTGENRTCRPNGTELKFVNGGRAGQGGSERSVEVTLESVSWFNHNRLGVPIVCIPPAEAEANYYQQLAEMTRAEV